jgi:hypothetical protein
LNRRLVIVTSTVLIALIVISLFLATNLFSNKEQPREFYVGVEFAYGDEASQVKTLVDKVSAVIILQSYLEMKAIQR